MKHWHEYTAAEREAEVGQIAAVVSMSLRIRHSARTEAAIAYLREPKRECRTCFWIGDCSTFEYGPCSQWRPEH